MAQRKTYGNTWWGKQWLNALAHIDYSNRLPRGRSYANRGFVKEINIEGNKITAKVAGSRPRPYNVDFKIPRFSPNEKAAIIETVTANPLHLSKLLNRQLPTELKDLLSRKDIQLFPNSWKDLEGGCSCPDWAVPCKHMAAVLYLVANEIDKNPFLVFQLHDFDLFEGLKAIGYAEQGQVEIEIKSIENLWSAYNFHESEYKWSSEIYNQLDFSKLPDCREDLLQLLSDEIVFHPRGDFKKLIDTCYKKVAKNVSKLKPVDHAADMESYLFQVEEIEVFLDTELDFLTCIFRNGKGKSIGDFDKLEKLIEKLEAVSPSGFNRFSDHLLGLHLTWFLAKKLAEHAAMIPQFLRYGAKYYKVRWLPAVLNEAVKQIHETVRQLVADNMLFIKKGNEIKMPIEEERFSTLLSVFLNYLVANYNGIENRKKESDVASIFFDGEATVFNEFEDREYPSAIQLWLNRFYIVEKDFIPVLQVLDENDGFEVTVCVQEKAKPNAPLITIQDLLTKNEYVNIRLEVLRDLAMLSDYFPQINLLVASKGEDRLIFNSEEFVEILFKILPTIGLFGIKVLLPKALRKLMRPSMSMLLEPGEDGTVVGSSVISLENLLQFQWKVAIGDKLVSPDEFRKMVKQFSGIVKLNDQYVFFDENEIKKLIEKMENPPEPSPQELLQIALTEDYDGAKVELDKKVKQLINNLLRGEPAEVPKGLKATLRPYQLRGYQWMYKNSKIGFGSLIADDMGLGKTLQVITTLLKLKEDGELGNAKALIVVPTTLLTNWEKEIAKFAPSLSTHVYHGSNRNLKPLKEADILITTYGVARSEVAILNKEKWLLLAIDEAQNIKNPGTAQTKAIKKIKAAVKIAMSGTPVENRLSEYWSIFDFTNKGYLNSLANFKKDFAKPIEAERDQMQLDRFRKITEPFILRRLKSDKSIIKDLPDKIEKDQFCSLTKEQTAIYQNVVESIMKSINEAEGISRKGLILKLITALKQVCNHPKQFLKKGNSDASLSGKTALLFDIIRETLDNGEKTLIFTQYREMGDLLVEMLGKEFQLEIPFLHGGVSRKGRDEMVEDFQNNRSTPIMILSLKAGGTGLNLTKASNVIHYDLWWNPAVEAQATDRAYRIGQQNNVMVHRFITEGTFEEKINKLLQSKKELANLTVSTGEKWIGDFSDNELKELVALG